MKGFPGVYYSDRDINKGFRLIAEGDHPGLDVAIEVLRMRLDARLANSGGHRADIDLSHPETVVVADVQDENEPVAFVYSRAKLAEAGAGIQADVRGLIKECRTLGGRVDWGEYIWEQVDFEGCLWKSREEIDE